MKILGETILTNYEAKKIMEKIGDESITFDQKVTKDFLNKYYNFDDKIYQEVKTSLSEKFQPHIVAMILNTLPEYEEQVLTIFAKERNKPSDEDIKFVLEEVAKLIK